MRRMFWMTVGAAGGVWAYKRGTRTVEEFRDRGLMGNMNFAAEQVRRGRLAASALAANLTAPPKPPAESADTVTTRSIDVTTRSIDVPSIDLSEEAHWTEVPRIARPSTNGGTRL